MSISLSRDLLVITIQKVHAFIGSSSIATHSLVCGTQDRQVANLAKIPVTSMAGKADLMQRPERFAARPIEALQESLQEAATLMHDRPLCVFDSD